MTCLGASERTRSEVLHRPCAPGGSIWKARPRLEQAAQLFHSSDLCTEDEPVPALNPARRNLGFERSSPGLK